MHLSITLSWPFVAAIVATAGPLIWLWRQPESSGPYDFSGLFTVPAAAFMIAVIWLAYFAARVAFGF